MCSLLVKKPLMTGGLLAFEGGTLVEESLAMIGLLALMSSFLVEMALAGRRLEAMALILPQFVHALPMEEAGVALGPVGLRAGHDWSNRLGHRGPNQ